MRCAFLNTIIVEQNIMLVAGHRKVAGVGEGEVRASVRVDPVYILRKLAVAYHHGVI